MATFTTPSGATVDGTTGALLSGPTNTNSGGGLSLSGTPSTSSTTPTPGTTGNQSASLGSFMSSNFDPYAQTIMGQFNSAQQANSASAASNTKSITDTGNYNLDYQSQQDKNAGTSMMEGGRGFVVNPGAIAVLQNQSTKRIRDLTTQMNDALANNQSSLAATNANLIAQENTALTNARTSFLNQYFQGQQEQRAEASFQTPEQQAVLQLAQTYAGAGITAQDTLQSAQAKVLANPQYKLALQATQSNINLQGAQAGLASSQAQQQNIVNNFLKGDTTQFSSDVSSLMNKSATDATLHAKYDNFPGGAGPAIIANIESQAQKQGWNPQASSLNSTAAQNNASSLGSGGLGGASTAVTNFGGNLFNSIFSPTSQSTSTVAPSTYKGFKLPF